MDRKFICPCGLTCCDCLFYRSEIYETARKLREVIQISQLDTFLNLIVQNKGWNSIAKYLGQEGSEFARHFDSFKKMPEFLSVLDGIIKLQCTTTCQESGGCSLGGATHECEALKCIKSKKYEGCWDCMKAGSCEKLTFLKRNYGETIEGNLRIIKDEGMEAVKSRGNKYYAWQRK
jgi:hypothetical protein